MPAPASARCPRPPAQRASFLSHRRQGQQVNSYIFYHSVLCAGKRWFLTRVPDCRQAVGPGYNRHHGGAQNKGARARAAALRYGGSKLEGGARQMVV